MLVRQLLRDLSANYTWAFTVLSSLPRDYKNLFIRRRGFELHYYYYLSLVELFYTSGEFFLF